MARLHKDESNEKKRFYSHIIRRPQFQKKEALNLCRRAVVDINRIGGGVEALDIFQQYLKEYKITVYDDIDGRSIFYEDPRNYSEKYIDLCYSAHHFDVIGSITGFIGRSYYCRKCHVGYTNKFRHRCPHACKRCLQSPACSEEPNYTKNCKDCHLTFKNANCFTKHKQVLFSNGKTICETIQYCTKCRTLYSLATIPKHICNYTKCSTCYKYVPSSHLCYIQTKKLKDLSENNVRYVFYDFECRQDEETGPAIREHIPNFAVIQMQCTMCLNDMNIENDCIYCGKREYIPDEYLEGTQLLDWFFDIITANVERLNRLYCFAHNSRGYDGQFILKYMIEKKEWTPEVILNGGLIQLIKYDKLSFKDSLNFFSAPLASLPKMMGIEGAKKGYFPHFFNTLENQEYIGELPAPEYYGVNEFSSKQRKEFLEWWEAEKAKNVQFDFKSEIKTYCRSDVDILRKALLKFRSLFITVGGTDPLDSITIAGACMELFRTRFLKKDLIGLMPFNGYRATDRQSQEALCWLKYLEKEHRAKIITAETGREVKIGGYKVDGYCENFNGNPTIFEYHVSCLNVEKK